MKKARKAFLSILLVISMIFATVAPAMALTITITTDKKETEEEGPAFVALDLVLETDKDSYTVDEEIEYTITLTNNTKKNATDIRVINFLSAGLKTSDGKMTTAFDDLAPGESASKTVYVAHQTYDNYGNDGIATALNVISIVFNVFKLVIGKLFASFLPYMCNLDVDMDGQLLGMLSMAFAYESTGEEADEEPDDEENEVEDNETEEEPIEPISGTDSSVDVYSIIELTIDTEQNSATVNISAPDNCAIVVRFIEEDLFFSDDFSQNKKYINNGNTFGAHVVPGGYDMEDLSFEINGTLPENFVAEAILIDGSGNPLCDPFVTIEYTQRYKQFAEKDIYSFDENDVVLQFTQSENDNFGVLADDVICLTASKVEYDVENNIYYITNPSDNFVVGDKIFITDGSGDYLFCAGEITESAGIITIIPASADDEEYGFGLSDFYKFLDVDMNYVGITAEEQEADDNESFPSEQNRVGSVEDIHIDKTISTALTLEAIYFNTEYVDIKGNVGGSISANIKLVYDLVLFGEDYFECDFTFSTDIYASLTVTVGTDHEPDVEEKEVPLGKIPIPFGVTGLSAFADIKANIRWAVSADLSLSGKYKTTQGYKYHSIEGSQKIDKKSSTWEIVCKGQAEISFGPKPSVGISFLDKVLKLSLNAFMGAKASAEAVVPVFKGGAEKHACQLCLSGDIKVVIEVDITLSYKITDTLKGTPIDWDLVRYEKLLFDFYASLINSPDSMFGGKFHFDRGSCPNKSYCTTFNALNNDNQIVEVNVSVYNSDGDMIKQVNSSESAYFVTGTYSAKATIDNTACETSFTITDGPKFVTLSPTAGAAYVNGAVLDAITKAPIEGAIIEVFEYTTSVATGVTNADGAYAIPLEEGSYKIVISKDDYVSATQYFTLRNGENKYLEALLMAEENEDSLMGGIYGIIKDGVTGHAVSDVDVKISRGWGNESATNTFIAEKKTNASGVYNCKKWSLFGVDFGLEAGNYTVTISKEGYITTSFNVTIVAGVDLEFNSTITPIGAENMYHIVLTWGANPSDLDSHLNGTVNGYRDHIYFSNKSGSGSWLDVDDTTSYGPETITIPDITEYEGIVTYSIHDYSNKSSNSSTAMSNSSAIIKVYKGGALLETFYVPTGVGGTVWNVFYFDENKTIVPVNSFSYSSSVDIYGSTS